MIDVKYNEVKDRNSWIDGNYLNATICVTEDCNLRCMVLCQDLVQVKMRFSSS